MIDSIKSDVFFRKTAYSSDKPKQEFNQIIDSISYYLNAMKNITFPASFGFQVISFETLKDFFYKPSQIELSLNRRKGEGLLYGLEHAYLRRCLLNKLPKKFRLHILRQKLNFHGILEYFSKYLSTDHWVFHDIIDLGMGGLVLKLDILCKGHMHAFVLKKKSCSAQSFYTKLLEGLDWPSYQVEIVSIQGQCWEVSTYLGKQVLSYLRDEAYQSEALEKSLASHAALGDVMGLGDRHLENYVFEGHEVYNIDVAFLFWPANESWTKRYIVGGAYEINILKPYLSNWDLLVQKQKIFWETYQKTCLEIKGKQSIIIKHIHEFYDSKTAIQYEAYVYHQLKNSEAYIQQQVKLYINGFFEMAIRDDYKNILQHLIKMGGISRDKYVLYMYYWADLNRPTTFLHSEAREPGIFDKIQEIAVANGCVNQTYFNSKKKTLQLLSKRLIQKISAYIKHDVTDKRLFYIE